MRNPNRLGARLAAGIAALAFAATAAAGPSVPYWGQVQSHLEVFDGAPLVAANWHGRYRPYVFVHDRFVPLMRSEPADAADVDLMSPLPVAADEVLLLGSAAGRPEYDLFLYDRRRDVLANLTATPTVDEGHPCVDADNRRLAYQGGRGEEVVKVEHVLVPLAHDRLPAFDRCVWVDATTLLGIERAGREYRLHRCTVDAAAVACERRAALAGVDAVTAVERSSADVTVIARRVGELFRRPFGLAAPYDALLPSAVGTAADGDVLDVDGTAFRLGFHGRYTSTAVPDSAATVYVARRIGDATYAIVATDHMTRTLARAAPDGWHVLREPSVAMPDHVASPIEIWMRAPGGEAYQAFYFGPPAPERVVVWWHGGPTESVSPRFNPYFHRLNEFGFGVLAVNYPGSTGRGAEYESRFRTAELRDCVRATWSYLRENDVRTVVSWSVSSGITVQSALLAEGIPISAIVDQSAWGRSTVRQEAARRGIPTFAIRGRYDPYGPTDRVDHWYPGGHDVTLAADFVGLFAAVAPFLASAPPLSWGDDPGARAEIALEVAATPADEALGLELATHLRRACFADRDVVVSPAGVPSLVPMERVRARFAAWLARHATIPVVRVRLRGAEVATAGRAAPSHVLDVRPIDLADAVEADRVRRRTVARDGSLVHPRLRAVAEAQCAALLAYVERHHDGGDPTRPVAR